jgi:hypothetical protein
MESTHFQRFIFIQKSYTNFFHVLGQQLKIYYNKSPKKLFQNSFIGNNYFQAKGHVIHLQSSHVGSLYLVCTH